MGSSGARAIHQAGRRLEPDAEGPLLCPDSVPVLVEEARHGDEHGAILRRAVVPGARPARGQGAVVQAHGLRRPRAAPVAVEVTEEHRDVRTLQLPWVAGRLGVGRGRPARGERDVPEQDCRSATHDQLATRVHHDWVGCARARRSRKRPGRAITKVAAR